MSEDRVGRGERRVRIESVCSARPTIAARRCRSTLAHGKTWRSRPRAASRAGEASPLGPVGPVLRTGEVATATRRDRHA